MAQHPDNAVYLAVLKELYRALIRRLFQAGHDHARIALLLGRTPIQDDPTCRLTQMEQFLFLVFRAKVTDKEEAHALK